MTKLYQCPLCGYKFEEKSNYCSNCPLLNKCDFIMCPNCNFEFPKVPLKNNSDENIRKRIFEGEK